MSKQCSACGSVASLSLLGRLGTLKWYRCRACGMDSHKVTRPRQPARPLLVPPTSPLPRH